MTNTIEFQNLMSNLIWLRKNAGLTKKQMAEILGIGTGSLNKIENGIYPPRLKVDVLFAVWYRFGVYPGELLTIRLDKSKHN